MTYSTQADDTMKRSKKRLASEAERRAARELVELYTSAKPVILTAGPNGEEQYRPLDASDLTFALTQFAETGSFLASVEAKRLSRTLLLNHTFRELRAAGDTYEVAVEKCAAKYGCSETTVRRSLSRRNRISLVLTKRH